MASSSSSPRNWLYDVFPSFSGVDIRLTFLSHFLKELDRKLIIAFRDNKIERGRSLDPELKQAIKDSRIAVVFFSKNYASSSWCLNELLEIVNCQKECGQTVIPVFYCLDPSHVRKQTGEFGEIFKETCRRIKSKEVKIKWKEALTNVANTLGYHSVTCGNEAKMIEGIVDDVLGKLLLTTSKDSEEFVGIEDHIANMGELLQLKSEEVRMVGIWGTSGIGKTTIARVLFNRLSRHFQGSIFIDRRFISKSMDIYSRGNPDDYNMKLHLQENFLSEILGKRHIKIDHLGVVAERLKNQKILIFIDDLDDQVVLHALAGETQWFGRGSRIVVITKDKHILRAHGIDLIYEVGLPSKDLALEMLCQSAFKKNSPPDDYLELASEVVLCAGHLPLGLNVLGSYLRGRDKEDWLDMLPRLQNGLDGKIDKALRVGYDGLNNKRDKAIFRHIACLFNGENVDDIKLLLDSHLNVNIGLKNLLDKCLIHVRKNSVEMHVLLQEMGKEIVRAQSNEPGEREFLFDSKDICDVLDNNTGTTKVLGIALDIYDIDELNIHESAFNEMHNLLFLEIYTKKWERIREGRWNLREGFNYLPPNLRLLRLDGYPMRRMPSNFRPESLVKLLMRQSKLEKLWDGVHSLTGLESMDLEESENLKEIPDLSSATNLKKLVLNSCSSLVELPSSIQYLNKLERLDMAFCESLETLPTGINLQSLFRLDLNDCPRLRTFPQISTNISELQLQGTAIEEFPSELHLENLTELRMSTVESGKLWEIAQPLTPLMTMLSPSLTTLSLSHIPSLVEFPSSFQNLDKLEYLTVRCCINLETFPTGINLKSLDVIDLTGCSRLRSFPDISNNISTLYLTQTAIEEVPWWIEKFAKLLNVTMNECSSLQRVSLNISKLKRLQVFDCSDCNALTKASWNDSPSAVNMAVSYQASSCLPDHYISKARLIFINCFNLDKEALLEQQTSVHVKNLELSGEEVPSYFTHRTTGTTLTNIPLLHNFPSQQFLRFRACVVIDSESFPTMDHSFVIQVCFRFIDRRGNYFNSPDWPMRLFKTQLGSHLFISTCHIPLNKENVDIAEHSYDHVDIKFRFSVEYSHLQLKGCGIRLLEDGPPQDNQPCNLDIPPRICEGETSNGDNLGGYEFEHNAIERRKSRKQMGVGRLLLKKLLSCYASKPQDT